MSLSDTDNMTISSTLYIYVPQSLHHPNLCPSQVQSGLPSVGETVPKALSMTPEQAVKDTVEEPIKVEALYIWLPPDPLQHRAYICTYNVQHLGDGDSRREMRKKE